MTAVKDNSPAHALPAHALPVRVYWEDTDASGLVYHASYIRFMERGRTELLRELGLSQRALFEGQGHGGGRAIYFVVRRMEVDFVKPAVLDDALVVETRAQALGGASLSLDQRVMRGGELLCGAMVKVVCVENGRARRMPPEMRAKFETALRTIG